MTAHSLFTPEQREILEPLAGLIGKVLGAAVFTQLRVEALESLLKEGRIITDEKIEVANQRADARWQSGLMIDALLDRDTHTLLEELRRRLHGEEEA